MSEPPVVDKKYYEVAGSGSIGERLVIAARNRMYADFLRILEPKPSALLLDVGVSEIMNDGANMLEQLYPYPDHITAAGLGEGQDFRTVFPTVEYVQIEPSKSLPFRDGEFDIACANAVLEHVGSRELQRAFIHELARVGRRVFLTVPHRSFRWNTIRRSLYSILPTPPFVIHSHSKVTG